MGYCWVLTHRAEVLGMQHEGTQGRKMGLRVLTHTARRGDPTHSGTPGIPSTQTEVMPASKLGARTGVLRVLIFAWGYVGYSEHSPGAPLSPLAPATPGEPAAFRRDTGVNNGYSEYSHRRTWGTPSTRTGSTKSRRRSGRGEPIQSRRRLKQTQTGTPAIRHRLYRDSEYSQ
jgi:hypothetical protein